MLRAAAEEEILISSQKVLPQVFHKPIVPFIGRFSHSLESSGK